MLTELQNICHKSYQKNAYIVFQYNRQKGLCHTKSTCKAPVISYVSRLAGCRGYA